jgi:hypothetical protein
MTNPSIAYSNSMNMGILISIACTVYRSLGMAMLSLYSSILEDHDDWMDEDKKWCTLIRAERQLQWTEDHQRLLEMEKNINTNVDTKISSQSLKREQELLAKQLTALTNRSSMTKRSSLGGGSGNDRRERAVAISKGLQACISHRTCTYVISGSLNIRQKFYRCLTCSELLELDDDSTFEICQICARSDCHRGHRIEECDDSNQNGDNDGPAAGYCDCGSRRAMTAARIRYGVEAPVGADVWPSPKMGEAAHRLHAVDIFNDDDASLRQASDDDDDEVTRILPNDNDGDVSDANENDPSVVMVSPTTRSITTTSTKRGRGGRHRGPHATISTSSPSPSSPAPSALLSVSVTSSSVPMRRPRSRPRKPSSIPTNNDGHDANDHLLPTSLSPLLNSNNNQKNDHGEAEMDETNDMDDHDLKNYNDDINKGDFISPFNRR